MKIKLIFNLLSLMFLISCSDNVTISKEEYQQLKGDTVKPKYPKIIYCDNEEFKIYLGSDNHQYIRVISYYTKYHLEHYPDCEKCKSKNNLKLLQFPEISIKDTQYFVRADRIIRPIPAEHEYLIQDTAKWLNDVVKPAIRQNKVFISN